MTAEQRLFDLLQPEIKNQKLQLDKRLTSFVVDVRRMPPEVAEELRSLLDNDFPFLNFLKLDSLRTRSPDSTDAFIELIIWKYYQHYDLIFTPVSVKEEFVQALLELFDQGYQKGRFGEGVLSVDVENDHPILKLAELFAYSGGAAGFFHHQDKTRLIVDEDVLDSFSKLNNTITE